MLTILGILALLIFSVFTMISIFRRENLRVEIGKEAIGGISLDGDAPNTGRYYCPYQPCLTENVQESMERILTTLIAVVTTCPDCPPCSDHKI